MNWHEQRLCILDTETTGVQVRVDRIVQAALVFAGAGLPPERHTWLINPNMPIPPGATAVHGITDGMVQNQGRNAADALAEIAAMLTRHRELPVVIYNAPFDASLIRNELNRYGMFSDVFGENIVDPLLIDRSLFKKEKRLRKLADVCKHYGVDARSFGDAHGALADARATGALAWAMKSQIPMLAGATLVELYRAQVKWQGGAWPYQRGSEQ